MRTKIKENVISANNSNWAVRTTVWRQHYGRLSQWLFHFISNFDLIVLSSWSPSDLHKRKHLFFSFQLNWRICWWIRCQSEQRIYRQNHRRLQVWSELDYVSTGLFIHWLNVIQFVSVWKPGFMIIMVDFHVDNDPTPTPFIYSAVFLLFPRIINSTLKLSCQREL